MPYADYWTKFTRENGFQFDYQSQVDTWFSGLPGLWVQDGACQSGIRPIFDRTKEHLGSSDTGIVMTRRLLLEAVSAYRDRGIKPSGVTDPDTFMVRAVSLTLPETTSWVDFGRPHMTAKLGADLAMRYDASAPKRAMIESPITATISRPTRKRPKTARSWSARDPNRRC